jgi:hypothetical protein
MSFDSNAMLELAHLSRDRYQRAGCGGASKVYMTSQAYYDARGHKELSPWARLITETTVRWRQACESAVSEFRCDCRFTKEGFYYGDSIPF